MSVYLRPFEVKSNADSYKGVRWAMAHYLSPIGIQNFSITANGGDLASSPIYQNPGWPLSGGGSPIGY